MHAKDMVESGMKVILIRSVDTDILVLAAPLFFPLKNAGLSEL